MNTDKEAVIFLDVDGVLNRCGVSGQGLETAQVARLERIVRETGAGIVVSSTWRYKVHQRERLVKMCHQIGAVLRGWTPDLSVESRDSGIYKGVERGDEIQEWLDLHPEVTRFVILDDDSVGKALRGYQVMTESDVGLTDRLADEAVRRLNIEH